MSQSKLTDEKDDFVESLNLTPEKIRQDMESMKNFEGFPTGDDEDILNLSNPPYYTAYPNPYIKAFIEKYGNHYDEVTDDYHREPFVGDISEGKNDPIYNAHSYHTKVPHKAIMKFIEHYTEPGDIVFDGFCGSGMTGVASKISGRSSILIDLGTSSTYISRFYNSNLDANKMLGELNKLIAEFNKDYGWIYETKHGNTHIGKILSVIYSDIFKCPHCSFELTLWDTAVDKSSGEVRTEFSCPSCNAAISKTVCDKKFKTEFDKYLNKSIDIIDRKIVQIEYVFNGKRFSKLPDPFDFEQDKKIRSMNISYWIPIYRMPEGDESRRNDKTGITHIHHFYSSRNLLVLSHIRQKLIERNLPLSILTLLLINCSLMNRYGKRTGNVSGTLYIPSLSEDINVIEYLKRKLNGPKGIVKPLTQLNGISKKGKIIISTQSLTSIRNITSNSIDYVFTDPPFGSNLMYSELNFIWESWLKIFTENLKEAIINNTQNKDINEYKDLMTKCFKEYYRVLKPNRWITVEFHNSKAEIWKAIQEAIVKAGFIIGQVAVLDKQQGSFKQVTSAGAVKNDLVINAYKPSQKFSNNFLSRAGLDMEREFIDIHLEKLPIEPNIERTQQMLYSKLIAQYIQNGFEVRMDALEFYDMLGNNPEYFEERDGYWFKKEQVPEYEKRLKLAKNIGKFDTNQLLLFVNDERTTIIWLSQFLREPKTYSEIYTEWTQKWGESQDKMPELKIILEENFTTEEGKYRLPSIGEKKEKEEVRERRLSHEFQEILETARTEKKITTVRKEALLHGLMKLYNERNVDIIRLIGKRLDKRLIEADDDIYAIIDWASSKED